MLIMPRCGSACAVPGLLRAYQQPLGLAWLAHYHACLVAECSPDACVQARPEALHDQ